MADRAVRDRQTERAVRDSQTDRAVRDRESRDRPLPDLEGGGGVTEVRVSVLSCVAWRLMATGRVTTGVWEAGPGEADLSVFRTEADLSMFRTEADLSVFRTNVSCW